MKKILVISLAILFVMGIATEAFAATPGNMLSPGQGDKLGQGSLPGQAHRIFRLVRYVPASGTANSTTLTKDSIVIFCTTSDDGCTITTTTTSGDSRVAGIVVQAALTPDVLGRTATQDIGGRNWTWLQTYGKSQADFAAVNILTAGYAFGCSGEAGMATFWPIDGAVSTTTAGNAGFVFDDVAAGATDVEVFLRLD